MKYRNMNTLGHFDIETILTDLYANEISASISWVRNDGFNVTLGSPVRVERWSLGSIGEAVKWLRDQALFCYPDSEFAHKYGGFV